LGTAVFLGRRGWVRDLAVKRAVGVLEVMISG